MDAQDPPTVGDGGVHTHSSAPPAASTRTSHDFVADSAHLIARGRHADVYLMNDTQVLRRLRTGAATYPNVDLVRHLNDHGYPTARIIDVDGTDLIMERLHGPTLLQALYAAEVTMAEGVRILLDLHAALHALPIPTARSDAPVPPGRTSVLHLDLHPGNIMLTATGPQVVDWESARLGSPELDLATTALVFAEVVVDGNEFARAAHRMLRRYTEQAGPRFGDALLEATAVRSSHETLDPVERELLPQARVVVEQELQRLNRPGRQAQTAAG